MPPTAVRYWRLPELLHQRRPRRGAVASPQPVMGPVGGNEEEGAGHVRERSEVVGPKSGDDVLDHPRSSRRAVASPQLAAVDAVVGNEVEGPAHGGERIGVARGALAATAWALARVDVLDHPRAPAGAVASPQLAAVSAVPGGEEEGAGHVAEHAGRLAAGGRALVVARIDVLHQHGPRMRRPGPLTSTGASRTRRAAARARTRVLVNGGRRVSLRGLPWASITLTLGIPIRIGVADPSRIVGTTD